MKKLIWAILNFLKRELEDREYVLYYDVQPGDTFWEIILNAISYASPDARLLVTVREDDYNSRGNISREVSAMKKYRNYMKTRQEKSFSIQMNIFIV